MPWRDRHAGRGPAAQHGAMLTIPVSAAERASGTLSRASLDVALTAMRDDGLVVLADAVDPAHVAALRGRLAAEVAAVLARPDAPYNFTRANIQQSPPREAALLFRDVLCNDQAIAVTAALLGPGMVATLYSGNVALAGSTERQPVHVDSGHLWPEDSGPTPPYAIVVNLPLVDMDAGNGATELWPGSHRDCSQHRSMGLEVPAEVVARRRASHPPLQPRVRAGSLLLRDLRLWHAGMPNPSTAHRAMLAMVHAVAWLPPPEPFDFPLGSEALIAHPRLRTPARFVSELPDHRLLDHAYGLPPGPSGA